MLLLGTTRHLEDLDRQYSLAEDVVVTAIARGGSHGIDAFARADVYVLLDGERIAQVDDLELAPVAQLPLPGPRGQSMVAVGGSLLVGLEDARLALVEIRGGSATPLSSFEQVSGRDTWENPAGPSPDLRSLAVSDTGAWLANVHVGGLWRSEDRGATWENVIPADADVHEVTVAPGGRAAVAAAAGFGWSTDDGASWSWTTEGLHATYCRAVALDGESAYVTASTGPSTTDGRLFRSQLGAPFQPCAGGLPSSFPYNLDTGSLTARDGGVAIGTRDGQVWRSGDGGSTFEAVTERVGHVQVLRFV